MIGTRVKRNGVIGPIEAAMIEATSHPDISQGGSDGWCSPREVTEPMAEFFGGSCDVDPCSNESSIVKAKVAYTFGGLHLPWKLPNKRRGPNTVYQNDPYSKATAWTVKMVRELHDNVDELIRLSMASTSTAWWRMGCFKPKRNPRIIFTKRLKFIGPESKVGMTARFEPVLWYYGPRVKQFDRAFRHLESWSTWGS